MQLSPTQLKLIKEQAIREYKTKHKAYHSNRSLSNKIRRLLGRLIPINIGIGIIASLIYIYFKGFLDYIFVLLTAVIWITLVSAVLSAIIHKNS